MARRAVTPYLDEVVYKRLQELIKPKRVSREIDDLIRRRIAELEGGEYNPAETEDYEALKREHNRLVREAEKLRRHSDYELAKRLHEFKEKLGYSTTQLGNLLKKSQSWVVKHLNILKLERVMTRVITQSHFLRDVRSEDVMERLTERHAGVILSQPEPIREVLAHHVAMRVSHGSSPFCANRSRDNVAAGID